MSPGSAIPPGCMRSLWPTALLVLLTVAFATAAHAQDGSGGPGGPPDDGQPSATPGQTASDTTAPVLNGDVPQVPPPVANAKEGLGTKIGHGFSKAGQAIGGFFSAVGGGIASAVGAIGSGIAWAAKGLWAGIAWAAGGIWSGLAFVFTGLGHGIMALVKGIGWLFVQLGHGLVALTQGIGWLFVQLGHGLLALGSGIAWLSGLVWAGILALRPAKMDPTVYKVAAGSALAGSAAFAGYGLLGWIRKFGVIPGLAGFSRIQGDELLEHPVRRLLFDTVQANPGIHVSELARRSGTGWGTAVHHLDKLESGRLLVTRKVNNQKCYFENGGKVSRQDMAVAGAVRKDKAALITTYIESHPMATQKMVCEALDMSPALTSFHVRKLANLGVLEVVRRGKETLLATTQALRRVTQPTAPEPIPVAAPMLA